MNPIQRIRAGFPFEAENGLAWLSKSGAKTGYSETGTFEPGLESLVRDRTIQSLRYFVR